METKGKVRGAAECICVILVIIGVIADVYNGGLIRNKSIDTDNKMHAEGLKNTIETPPGVLVKAGPRQYISLSAGDWIYQTALKDGSVYEYDNAVTITKSEQESNPWVPRADAEVHLPTEIGMKSYSTAVSNKFEITNSNVTKFWGWKTATARAHLIDSKGVVKYPGYTYQKPTSSGCEGETRDQNVAGFPLQRYYKEDSGTFVTGKKCVSAPLEVWANGYTSGTAAKNGISCRAGAAYRVEGDVRPLLWGYQWSVDSNLNRGAWVCPEPSDGWKTGDWYLALEYVRSGFGTRGANFKIQTVNDATCKQWTNIKATYTCTTDVAATKAAIRPVVTLNPDSIIFASQAAKQNRGSSTVLTKSEFEKNLNASNSDGYKLTLQDPSMSVSKVSKRDGDNDIIKQSGNKIAIKKGISSITLNVEASGSGESTPTGISALSTNTDGSEEMFGTLAEYNASGTTEVTIDLSNLMDTSIDGETKTIQLYAEQQNGPQNTDYISAPYEIEVSVVDNDQTLALETGSVMTGEYGTDITLTAVVNEAASGAERKKFDAVKELTASVHEDDKDIAEVTGNTWNETTGKTTITLKPKKSGKVRLVLHKDDNFAAGYYVSANDVVTAEVDIGKRKVTLQPKKQTYTKNEIFQDTVIDNQYTGDTDKDGLVNGDTLPSTIKVKTENQATGEDDNITSRTVSGKKRFDSTGTWTQSIDMTDYDKEADASQPLKAKYEFTGATNDFIVKDAITPDDTYIDITPACTYETDDKKCWNNDTVTIKPSQKAKDAGYTKIKNTSVPDNEIEKSEEGFADSITISGPRTTIEDIKYNLESADDKFITNQGTVGKTIRIDTTAPSTINAKGEKTDSPSVTALLSLAEAAVKESVKAAGGNAEGIRFDSSQIKLTISAVDDDSGIRFVEAYKVGSDGIQGDKIALTPVEGDFEEKTGIAGPDNDIDENKTYSKKVYTALIPEKYNGKIKIVATNNAGLKSHKVTGLIVHETEQEATEGMVLAAGTGAVMNADGLTYNPNLTNGIVKDDLKFPLKIQAPKSGIKKITYYITDETTVAELAGSSTKPIDVTNEYGIKVPSETLNWEDAADNALDTSAHDKAVVSLKDAIVKAKENNKQILRIHAKLESNAGNVKEEMFDIKVIDQKIEWDESIQKADTDTDKTDNISAVEATYGTPLDISALMADTSTSWSSTGDFTYTLKSGDDKYAKLSATTQSSLTTTGNDVATDKGQAKVTLTPLTGNDTEVTLSVKKAGDDIHLESNEITLKIKLKSKPIKVTADPVTTYDLKTGEKLPVLTSKITDADGTGTGLVVDADASINDAAEDKKVDFLLKATGCVKDDDTCKIASLEAYEQGKTRILETGEWKLEYKFDQTDKTEGSRTGEFNKKYVVTFVDYDETDNTDKTLKVTQDSFTEDWYTITPEPNEKVKADADAWNNSTVTVKPTDKATTGEADTGKVRKYAQITNDVEIANGNPNDSETWGWATEFTHDKNEDTSAKIYSLRFYDPDTGAFTAAGNAKRSMRVDEDKPSEINFKTEIITDVSPILNIMEVIVEEIGGNADGIRFANKETKLTIDATDLRSGIREIKAYKVNEDGTQGAAIPLTFKEDKSEENTAVPGPTTDVSTYSKKTYTAELNSSFNSKVMIVAMDNAGNESTKTTNKIVIEMSDEAGMVLDAGKDALKNAAGQYTVSNTYVNGTPETLWPLKIQAKESGIKKITYYITDSENKPLSGAADHPFDVTGTGDGTFGITELDNKVDWTKADEAALVTDEKDEAVVSLRDAVNAMKGKANAVIKVHAKLESNAGNIVEKTFDIHISNQQIDWSQSVKDLDTNKDDDVLTLEAEYGKPIKLSAEMVKESTAWSEGSDFTFTLSEEDKKYAHLSNVTYSDLTTDGNTTGSAKGKGEITLTPLTGNDQTITLKVKKTGDDTYLESNEVSLTVKLKSKPIDITADPKTTYDVRTGEVHPKLTWTITEKGKSGVDGLVKDDAAGIDDTAEEQKVDFLLKATDCVTAGGCEGLASLEDYEQTVTRINKVGEWKLEFQYDKTVKNEDTIEDKFNRKYDITFIDSKTADVGIDKTLQVTQDAFETDWYSITPELEDALKSDTDAWNKATVTIKPTDKAKLETGSGDAKKTRNYTDLTNDVLLKDADVNKPESWEWKTEFTHDKDEGTDPKTYTIRFRDPVTGAFTSAKDVTRSVRVDEDTPTEINFHSKVKEEVSPVLNLMADVVEAVGGDASGIRFANKATILTIDATDATSGIREIKAYKVDDSGNRGEELSLEFKETESSKKDGVKGPGNDQDGETTYSTKVYTIELASDFNSKVEIVATDNAGNESKKTTNKIVIEKPDTNDLVLTAGADAPKNDAGEYTVSNSYVNGEPETLWPLKIKAPHSGIKEITYYITDEDEIALDGSKEKPIDISGTDAFDIKELPNEVAWTAADEAQLDVDEHDKGVVSLKSAVEQMKGKANAVIKVHAKLVSNAGNEKEEVFDIHISNQQIDWSESVKALDTTPDNLDELTLEATYGTPLTISAEMIQESTGWSGTSDFTYALGTGEEKYADITSNGTTHEKLITDANVEGTEKGKAVINLYPLTGNDQEITLTVKKGSDSTYAESNELKLKVKLKSKKIDITADPTTTYDLRTGEKHPKLTWKITDEGKEDGGLVSYETPAVDDAETYKDIDFLLKATDCVTENSCGSLTTLKNYEQGKSLINETGTWKLEFQYDKDQKDGDTSEAVFNRKYDITFIDHKTPEKGSDKVLEVTQDSFTEEWYSISPDLEEVVKDDKHAWNTATVTIKPTKLAKTTSGTGATEKVRTYKTITNDVLIKDVSDKAPDTWKWEDEFTRTKDEGTDAKTYKLRFRDPTTGAFTAEADAKRSVRVDETAPLKPFISVNEGSDPALIPDAGLVQGKRFSNDGLRIRTSIEDAESGIRTFNVYTVVKNIADDGTVTEVEKKIDVTEDMIKDEASTVDGVTEDGTKAVKKRTIAFTIDEEFKGSIRIKAMNNAGEETTFETTQLINEPIAASKLTVTKDETEDNKIPEKITRDNYVDTYLYPMKIDAPISGIKSIKYTMWVDDVSEETVKKLLTNTKDITTDLGVTEVEDKAVLNTDTVKTPTYALNKDTEKYGDYFLIKEYIEKMIEQKVELGNITIKIELESNAGNKLEQKFELPVDLLLNDAASYIITPKRIMLENTEDENGDVKEAVGTGKVELIEITEESKPAGQDITQYFNIYTPHEITLENAETKTNETYTVSVFDEDGKKLTSEKNLLAYLIYDTKKEAGFTLKTPLVTNPEKEKFRGEYNGLMTYTVKYGKKDEGKQP